MPNLWQNRVSDQVRILAAFAPVDEENTRIYLRFYQRLTAAPGVRQLLCAAGCSLNRVVLHQDRRVVVTQLPRKSQLEMGENLVQGDLPIIEYRRGYQTRKEAQAIF
jgi:phenylpropionate dioxygenase-like ring-hydroxylating dioxygenase large terminal subunit